MFDCCYFVCKFKLIIYKSTYNFEKAVNYAQKEEEEAKKKT